MKKLLAVFLAVLMIFTVMAVPAFAADTAEEEEENQTIIEMLFDNMDGKKTLFQFATEDFGSFAGFFAAMPILTLLQTVFVVLFTVLDAMNLDLMSVLASFGIELSL